MEYGGNDQRHYLQMTLSQVSFRRNMAEYTGTGLRCSSVLRHWCPGVQPSSVLSSSLFIALLRQLVYTR